MIGIILQARSNSTRLPSKIFMDLNGQYSIQRILSGCKKTICPNKIILAMPKEDKQEIERRLSCGELSNCTDDRFELFIGDGDQNNLIDRFHGAARKFGLDIVIRLTADNPLYEGYSFGIDEMVSEYLHNGSTGFMGNNLTVATNPYPSGIDVEIFSYEMLCWAKLHVKTEYCLEHCAPSFYSGDSPFKIMPFNNNRPHTMISTKIPSFTMDTINDYNFLLALTENYDRTQDLNKAIETLKIQKMVETK